MDQVEVKYAPGMRIIVRGEEWMVKKVETNSDIVNIGLHFFHKDVRLYAASCSEV